MEKSSNKPLKNPNFKINQTSFDLFLALSEIGSGDFYRSFDINEYGLPFREYYYKGNVVGICNYEYGNDPFLGNKAYPPKDRTVFFMQLLLTINGRISRNTSPLIKLALSGVEDKFQESRKNLQKINPNFKNLKDIGKYIMYDIINYAKSLGYKFFDFQSEKNVLDFYKKVLNDFKSKKYIKDFSCNDNNLFNVIL